MNLTSEVAHLWPTILRCSAFHRREALHACPDAPDLLVMASVRVWGVHPLLCALFLARRHV